MRSRITLRSSTWFVAFALIAGGTAHAQPHMGVLPSDHVVLESITGPLDGCGSGGFEFHRILPDGSAANGFFRVPARKVLVVTDVDWQYQNTTAEGPGSLQTLRLFIGKVADPGD